MSNKKSRGISKLTLGMILLALGGLFLGASIGYYATNRYLNNKVLEDMKKEGYVLTDNATATAEDIVEGKSAYVNGELVNGTMFVLDTSDATAMAEYIRFGKTAYVNGELVIGNLKEVKGETVTPGRQAYTVSGYGILMSDIVIKGDANLVAGNIALNESLWGIRGTYEKIIITPVEPDPVEEGGGQ